MIIFMVMVCFLLEAMGVLCLMKYYRKVRPPAALLNCSDAAAAGSTDVQPVGE